MRSAPGLGALNGSLDTLLCRVDDLRPIAVLRVLMGAVVIRHLWPDLTATTLPVERFHVPWWAWLPVPSPGVYRALVWVGVLAGVCMLFGLLARAATVFALLAVSYLLFLDMTGYAHNRAFLVWLLVGLSLAPAAPRVGLGRLLAGPGSSTGLTWPVVILRLVVASVYLTSGLTKLLDADWRSGLVLWDRVVRLQHSIPFGGWIEDVLVARTFHRVLAPSAILAELFIGLGLWSRRTRLAAIWVAIVFHTSIEITASVQTFSYSAIAALLIWVTPSTRDRTLLAAAPRLAGAVRRLDWLHRFAVDPEAEGARPGEHVVEPVIVDRDGTVRTGFEARLVVLSRLPLTFPVVAPALALHRWRARQSRGPSRRSPAPDERIAT